MAYSLSYYFIMKKLFTVLMLIPILLFGQNELYTKIDSAKNILLKHCCNNKNNIYAEAHLGLFYQVVMNYETRIYSGERISWYSRLGGGIGGIFGEIIEWKKNTGGWGGLGAITMLTGKKNHHIELNVGAFIGDEGRYDARFIFPIFNIGYRYQKPNGGFIFRLNQGAESLGISFGYAF